MTCADCEKAISRGALCAADRQARAAAAVCANRFVKLFPIIHRSCRHGRMAEFLKPALLAVLNRWRTSAQRCQRFPSADSTHELHEI
jgi:hypothetical protein